MKYVDISQWSFLKHDTPANLIRLGSLRDGGYVLKESVVKDSKFMISGGIAVNSEFENQFYELNNNAKIILIDGSISILKNFILRPLYYFFMKKGKILQPLKSSLDFFYIRKKSIFLKKFLNNSFTISTLLKTYVDDSSKGFLKLDIEGSEWELLDDILANKHRFLGMAIEFHKVPANIEKLEYFVKNVGLKICFISINESGSTKNGLPNLLEITFLDPKYFEKTPDEEHISLRRVNLPDNELLIPVFS